MKVQNYRFIVMVVFSKFITGQRGSQQLLDTDGFTYNLQQSYGVINKMINLNWTLGIQLYVIVKKVLNLNWTLGIQRYEIIKKYLI